MERTVLIDVLENFISGRIKIDELADTIDGWLFEFRQKPDLVPEQRLLSNLELYLHEVAEGYRPWEELYEQIFAIIERDLSEYYVKTVPLQTSHIQEIDTTTRAIPVRDYYPNLSPV